MNLLLWLLWWLLLDRLEWLNELLGWLNWLYDGVLLLLLLLLMLLLWLNCWCWLSY